MDVKKLALLIGALVVAAVTAVMAKSMFGSAAVAPVQAAAVVPAGPDVLVATRPLPTGTILTPDAFRFQPWPKDLIDKAYYVRGQDGFDPAKLTGSVVRYTITAGQPLTQGAVVNPGDRGFLAAALGPGMRAITVSVSAQAGVAGFVFPGDRVDLVLTQEVTGGGDGPPLKASETIVRNLRVLATDQRTTSTDETGKTDVRTFATVTMEATPKIAEKIAVAQSLGSLSLSLRSLADNNADLEKAIAAGEVKVPATDDPKAERQMLLAVASRPIDSDPTYTTGAEVSRFQRSTVPGKASGPMSQQMAGGPQPGSGMAAVAMGPVVNVARGNAVTVTPAGGK